MLVQIKLLVQIFAKLTAYLPKSGILFQSQTKKDTIYAMKKVKPFLTQKS